MAAETITKDKQSTKQKQDKSNCLNCLPCGDCGLSDAMANYSCEACSCLPW